MGRKLTKKQRRRLLIAAVGLVAVLIIGVWLFTPQLVMGAKQTVTTGAESSTPFGESLEIELTSGTETTGEASMWEMSYSDSTSQDVYDVDGVYKSQEQVTLSYSLSVTHSNVESIQVVSCTIKAESGVNTHTYTLASAKPLTGVSPISDSGSTTVGIATHLGTDIGASVTGATVDYLIYAQVTATGSVSGQTLTATITETQFSSLTYTRTSESSSATVTPTVSVAGWWEGLNTPTGVVFAGMALGIVLLVLKYGR